VTRRADPPLPGPEGSEAARFLGGLKGARAALLLLDYDGTLAPFRTEPAEAAPYPGVLPLLQAIRGEGRTRVALISGRSLDGLLPMLGVDPLPEVWASHGRERRLADGRTRVIPPSPEQARGLEEAERRLGGFGLPSRREKKPFSLAYHVRGLPPGRGEEALRAVQGLWGEVAQTSGLELLPFDGGLELRAPGWTKGDAVRAILKEAPPGCPAAYLGDDETDEDAFRALGSRGLPVLVREAWRPSSARAWLRPPGELTEFLRRWHERTEWKEKTGAGHPPPR